MGGQREIAEGGKAEAECDRDAGENAKAGNADKENDQVEIAERPQPRLRQPKYPDQQANRPHRAQYRASRSNANSAIRPMPAGSAAARQTLEICSAGVVIKLSS